MANFTSLWIIYHFWNIFAGSASLASLVFFPQSKITTKLVNFGVALKVCMIY